MAMTSDEDLDDRLAALLAPQEARYVLICRECRSAWPYERDSKTVKAARDGEATCPECGEAVDLAVDAKEGGD